MNRIQATQLMAFVTCSLFIIAYSVPPGNFLAAHPQDNLVAYPQHIGPLASYNTPHGYSPSKIRTAYNLPSSGGAGTTIAIIDSYDTPTIWDDLGNFSSRFNLPLPTNNNFIVHKMKQDIGFDVNWALETCLDVEWAHAIAPNATILLVEAANDSTSGLFEAVDYATNQSGVVAVSMSWGTDMEYYWENSYDHYFNKAGIVFFAASGDTGSLVIYPSCSKYVVAVGGTTLNLASDGTVISETGWSDGGGGISAYENMPSYQTNYGLSGTYRSVPDVSYNANPETGVSVYYSGSSSSPWYTVGGTSAGAPQWAAIHALGVSASNVNLYQKAKSNYSSYFRDITSGTNGAYTAGPGYDNVAGLGSPLTCKFGTALEVSPVSGPANGSITVNGLGFTAGNSLNISYLNPTNSTWMPITSNYIATTENFTYTLNAPDLLQNNLAGDNQAAFDNIVFRVKDNNTSRLYNSTAPYAEMRRGLTRVSNVSAAGLYGNNSDLSLNVFVQDAQSIAVSGSWFSPGSASMFWDDTVSLGSIAVDGSGSFNANVQVPTTTAGQHRLTINDGASAFCINLTRLPAVTNDYLDAGWHTSDFTVNLAPDYPVNETFYRINGGAISNVTGNGQPTIATEGSSNTLEYWSTWNVYGTGNMELPHVTLTGLKLDKTAPQGTITTSATTTTPTITLALAATDSALGTIQMRFSNDNIAWSNWEPFAPEKTWSLTNGNGQKTVEVQFMDSAGLTSTYSYVVALQTLQPTAAPTTAPTMAPTHSPAPTATPSPAQTESATPTENPQTTAPTPLPETTTWALILIALSTLMLAVCYRKKLK